MSTNSFLNSKPRNFKPTKINDFTVVSRDLTERFFVSCRIIAARIDGSLDFLELETFHNPVMPTTSQSHNTSHVKGNNNIIAARIDGSLDFLELETFHNPVMPTTSQSHSTSHVKGNNIIWICNTINADNPFSINQDSTFQNLSGPTTDIK